MDRKERTNLDEIMNGVQNLDQLLQTLNQKRKHPHRGVPGHGSGSGAIFRRGRLALRPLRPMIAGHIDTFFVTQKHIQGYFLAGTESFDFACIQKLYLFRL